MNCISNPALVSFFTFLSICSLFLAIKSFHRCYSPFSLSNPPSDVCLIFGSQIFFEICALRSNDSLPKALERVWEMAPEKHCINLQFLEFVIVLSHRLFPSLPVAPSVYLVIYLVEHFSETFSLNSRCISSLSPGVSECPLDISSVNDCAGPDSNEPIKIRRILFVTVSSSNQIRYLVTPNAFFSHMPYHLYTMLHLYTFFFFFN